MKSRLIIVNSMQWDVSSQIIDSYCDTLVQAVSQIDTWLGVPGCLERSVKKSGGIRIVSSPWIWQKLGFHHVEYNTIFLDPRNLAMDTVVHEFAHIFDNLLGSHILAAIFGGGPSDDMIRYLGIEPDQFFPRFHSPGYERSFQENHIELNPTVYGRTYGPAEDFAETFKLAVLDPERLFLAAPRRYKWIQNWKNEHFFNPDSLTLTGRKSADND